MATYQSIRYNIDYGGKAGSLMPLLLFTSDGSDANATFSTKIDSTYDEYLFIMTNLHGQTHDRWLGWQANAVGGSGFNETITSTFFYNSHHENGSSVEFTTAGWGAQAQGTLFSRINQGSANNSDDNQSGWLRLYNPSSTSSVTHYMTRSCTDEESPAAMDTYTAGYINSSAAIDEVRFQFSSGEIQGGTIGMFGVI